MSLAKNYARAFFEVSSPGGSANELVLGYKAELVAFAALIQGSRELRLSLVAPVTPSKEKVAVVQEISVKQNLSKPVTRFLSLLAQNNRLSVLSEVIDALDEVRLGVEGGLLGRIVSAEPLEPQAIKEITDAFTQKLKKKVEFKVSSDSNLLAGLKVTVNGVTYDGTLLSQLERLKESFVRGAGTIR